MLRQPPIHGGATAAGAVPTHGLGGVVGVLVQVVEGRLVLLVLVLVLLVLCQGVKLGEICHGGPRVLTGVGVG